MTRNHILKTSLEIFNRKGYSYTHLEDVLDEGDIQKPNFLEHFDSLDEVVTILFKHLCEESDEAAQQVDQSGPILGVIHASMLRSYQIQVKYRFIFLDFFNILNRIESIKDRYYELVSLRKTQLIHLFQSLSDAGIFRKEMVSGQFEKLAYHLTMLSDYWLTHNHIMFGEPSQPDYYTRLISASIVPYLTEEGLEEFNKLN